MRKTTWIRFGLASIIAGSAAAAMLAAGCSSNNNTPGTNEDASSPETGPTTDGGTNDGSAKPDGSTHDAAVDAPVSHNDATSGDAATDTGPATKPIAPWVTFVNALPNFQPNGSPYSGYVSLCLAATAPVADVPALPPEANIPPNAGGGMQFAAPAGTSFASFDLTTFSIAIYGVSTAVAASAKVADGGPALCDVLVAPDAGYGAVNFGVIPAKTLSNTGASYVLLLTGCAPGDTSGKCGAGYDGGVGNYGMQLVQVDTTTMYDAGIGVQFIQGSSQWDSIAAYTAASSSQSAYAATGASITYNRAEEAANLPRPMFVPFADGGASDAATDAPMTSDAATDATTDAPVTPTLPSDQPLGATKFGGGVIPASAAQTLAFAPANYMPDAGETPGLAVAAMNVDGGYVMASLTQPFGFGLEAMYIQAETFGMGDAGPNPDPQGFSFLQSGNWTFILLGDPSQPGTTDAGTPNQLAPHILAVPNVLPTADGGLSLP